jgi:pimeloyl-ACP methyl ester carboxylesterase
MKLELLTVLATDKVQLTSLLYNPAKKTKKVGIWLHGMGDSGVFYNPTRTNALGKALTDRGIAFLALNNRGAHNVKSLRIADDALPEEERSFQGGTFFELIDDCVSDIDGAVSFLEAHGFDEFYLLGHSTGANKICAYSAKSITNVFSKYVLAGPGDDSGIFYTELGDEKFWKAIELARKAISIGKPLQIMPVSSGMNPFSAQSALDILDPDGPYNTFPFYEATTRRLGKKPLFKEYSAITMPTLIVFGEADEYAFTAGSATRALEILESQINPSVIKQSGFKLISGADHSFHGTEKEFATTVADWLAHG